MIEPKYNQFMRRLGRGILWRITLVLALILFYPLNVVAQTNIEIQENTYQLNFPDDIIFSLKVSSGQPIEAIYLQYGSNGRTCLKSTARQKVTFTAGTEVEVEWKWDFHKSGGLPPGAEIWWQWEIQDQSGNLVVTDKQQMTVEDDALSWRSISEANVTVVWAQGGQSFGDRILQISVDALEKLSREAGISPEGGVRLNIYPSTQTLKDSLLFESDWVGGIAYPEYGITSIGIAEDGLDWAEDAIPHELAHLVTNELIFNCLGVYIPTWLSEGIAVYAEGELPEWKINSVLQELQAGTLPSLRSLAAGFAADADKANLSYNQSGMVVTYMIKEYGADKIAQLLDTIQSGKMIDPALQEVYGVDTDQLDAAWRISLGYEANLPVQAGETPTATQERTAVPTLALWTPAFGGADATETPSAALSPTEEPTEIIAAAATDTAAPPTETPSPALQSTATPSAAPALTATPMPAVSTSPLRCLGGNIAAPGLALLALIPRALRRKGQ